MSRAVQPLEAANNPAALLRVETVQALTGLCRASIYSRIKSKTFPPPVLQGNRCTRWRASDVTGWLEEVAQ